MSKEQDLDSVRARTHPYVATMVCAAFIVFALATGLRESTLGIASVGLVCALVVAVLMRLSIFEMIIITIPTSVYFGGAGSTLNTSVSDIVLVVALFQICTSTQLQQTWRDIRHKVLPVPVCIMLMIATMTLPILMWPRPEFSFQNYALDAMKLVIIALYFVVVAIYTVHALRKKDFRFIYVWVAVAVLESILGIAGAMAANNGHSNIFAFSYRAIGTFSDPNSFAAYLVSSICLVWLAYWLSEKWSVLLCAIPIAFGVLFSGSRGGLAVLGLVFLGAALMSLFIPRFRNALVAFVVLGCVGFYAAYDRLLDNQAVERSFSDVDTDSRWVLTEIAIQMWRDSPVIGSGLGQFRFLSDTYLAGESGTLTHNTYLSILAEGGLVAIAIFLFILIYVLVALFKTKGSGKFPIIMGITAVAASAMTLNLQNFRPLWALLGLGLGWSVWKSETRAQESTGDTSAQTGQVASLRQKSQSPVQASP